MVVQTNTYFSLNHNYLICKYRWIILNSRQAHKLKLMSWNDEN